MRSGKKLNKTGLRKTLSRVESKLRRLKPGWNGRETARKEVGTPFQTVAEATAAAIFIFQGAQLCYANPMAAQITGYSADELVQKQFWEIIHPEFRDMVRERGHARQRGDGVPSRYEVKILTKSGEVRWVDFTGRVIEFKKESAVLGTVIDITERKQTEKALRFAKFAVDNSVDAIYWVKSDGTIFYVNRSGCELVSYSEEELLCMTFVQLNVEFSEEDWPTKWIGMRQAGTSLFESQHIAKSGRVFPVEILGTCLWYRGHEYMCACVRDITARKHAEKGLLASEERVRLTLEALEAGGWDWNVSTGEVFFSDSWLRSLGYSRSEVTPDIDFWKSLLHPDDLANAEKCLASHFAGDTPCYACENQLRLHSGDFRHNCTRGKVVSRNEAGLPTRMVGTDTDISEQKETERELQERGEKLRGLTAYLQSVREKERTAIAREMHDELGQVLTVLKMDLALMGADIGEAKGRERFTSIASEIQGMQDLIDKTIVRVRELVRSLRPEVLDTLGLIPALHWQADDISNRSGMTCAFKCHLQEHPFESEFANAVFRIFQETLTNIMRHAKATKFCVDIAEQDGNLLLRVSDNGVGIADTQFVDERTYGLMGMKERAFMLGGTLEIMSSPGQGTTVVAILPMSVSTPLVPA